MSDDKFKELEAEIHAAQIEAGKLNINSDIRDYWISVRATLKLLEKVQPFKDIDEKIPLPEPTFNEWAAQKQLKTHLDRVLAAAVYRLKESQESIDIKQAEEIYKKARWKLPVNMPDVFARAAKSLFFVEADEESENGLKAWKVTQTGINYFNNLSKENG